MQDIENYPIFLSAFAIFIIIIIPDLQQASRNSKQIKQNRKYDAASTRFQIQKKFRQQAFNCSLFDQKL